MGEDPLLLLMEKHPVEVLPNLSSTPDPLRLVVCLCDTQPHSGCITIEAALP